MGVEAGRRGSAAGGQDAPGSISWSPLAQNCWKSNACSSGGR